MKNIIFFLSIILITSCGRNRFEGYKYSNDGIYFKLHSLGEDSIAIHPGDFITCDLVYATMQDSQFFSARRKFQLNQDINTGDFDKCFTKLNENDSASFMIPNRQFFENTLNVTVPDFISDDEFIKISTRVIEVQSEEQFEREKQAFLHWIKDFDEYEKILLEQFINEKHIENKTTKSGMYYIVMEEGDGPGVNIGDTLVVHYEGRFLNGKFFDSTIKRHEPFSFIYGTEWQVIEGLEEALGYMHEGEKALFIMPSDVAWGSAGSSTGIIPPYTSLIFEVELLKVNDIGAYQL